MEDRLDHLNTLLERIRKTNAGTIHGQTTVRDTVVEALETLVLELTDLRASIRNLEEEE